MTSPPTMKSSFVSISLLSLFGTVFGGSDVLARGSQRRSNSDLPGIPPRILQGGKGPGKGGRWPPAPVQAPFYPPVVPPFHAPVEPPVSWPYTLPPFTVSPYPTTAGSVPPSLPPIETYTPTYAGSEPVVATKAPVPPPVSTNGTTPPTYAGSEPVAATKAPFVAGQPTTVSRPPQLSVHDTACNAAEQGTVYKTSHSASFDYYYELLTTTASNVSDVTSQVDKSLQSYIAPKLVGCQGERRMATSNITILGVSQATSDTEAAISCTYLAPTNETDKACYTIQSTVTVYLKENNGDAELSTRVFRELSDALGNDSPLLNTESGIFGVYFLGADMPIHQPAETADSPNAVQVGSTSSSSGSGLTLSPGSIAVIAAACLTVIVVGFLVYRRGRKWPAAHKAGLMNSRMPRYNSDGMLDDDDSTSTPTAANVSPERDGMIVEYDDDGSRGSRVLYLSHKPLSKEEDRVGIEPITNHVTRSKRGWFAYRSRSPPSIQDDAAMAISVPRVEPDRSTSRKYSVDDTVEL